MGDEIQNAGQMTEQQQAAGEFTDGEAAGPYGGAPVEGGESREHVERTETIDRETSGGVPEGQQDPGTTTHGAPGAEGDDASGQGDSETNASRQGEPGTVDHAAEGQQPGEQETGAEQTGTGDGTELAGAQTGGSTTPGGETGGGQAQGDTPSEPSEQ